MKIANVSIIGSDCFGAGFILKLSIFCSQMIASIAGVASAVEPTAGGAINYEKTHYSNSYFS